MCNVCSIKLKCIRGVYEPNRARFTQPAHLGINKDSLKNSMPKFYYFRSFTSTLMKLLLRLDLRIINNNIKILLLI